MKCGTKTKKMMKGGMAEKGMDKKEMMMEKMGKKKAYAKGGKVRGAGCATKGTRSAKIV